MSVAVVAFGAVSALGEGRDAFDAGHAGDPARVVISRDDELERAGLARPFAARACARVAAEGADRATVLLSRALDQCERALDDALPAWRGLRVGLAIGTSSGGMRSAETLFVRLARGESIDAEGAARAAYFGPMLDAIARAPGRSLVFAPSTLVLGACASSAIAIGLASRWLALSECDVALAAGFDAVATFVASGFEALRATSARIPPRPFRVDRDGMALGEGAAVVALVRVDGEGAPVPRIAPLGYVCGFGASSDAVHITAPDRTGAGLAIAARAALDEAGRPRVDLVSAHATGTPFNDASEARAIEAALGSRDVPTHAFKAQAGHTLGAAGVLESLAALDALERGVLPATAGEGPLDEDARVHLVDRVTPASPRVALKLASAFGGANAALVLAREALPSTRPLPEDAWITRAAHVARLPSLETLAAALGASPDRLARCDSHVTWCLAAIDALVRRIGREALAGAGVVVGTTAATLETNALFASRLRDRGARFVEPRRFPYTSPNAAAGECSLAFGLRGPSFSVGSGAHAALEALAVASVLVRAGDADRMIVVAVDDVGDVVRAWSTATGVPLEAGAVALLVTHARIDRSVARVLGARVALGSTAASIAAAPSALAPAGHLALALLDADPVPATLESTSSWLASRAHARVDLAVI